MLLLPSRTPAPVPGSWSDARLDVPAVWTMGEWRLLEHSPVKSRASTLDRSNGPAMSWSMKFDLASLSAIQAGSFNDSVDPLAMPAADLLPDRINTPANQDAPAALVPESPALPSLALDQYAMANRLYFVPAGLSSFSGQFASDMMSLDYSGGPVIPPIGGGGDPGGGGVTPPDVGGGFGHGGIPGSGGATPEPSGAILTLLGLALTCGRRRKRR